MSPDRPNYLFLLFGFGDGLPYPSFLDKPQRKVVHLRSAATWLFTTVVLGQLLGCGDAMPYVKWFNASGRDLTLAIGDQHWRLPDRTGSELPWGGDSATFQFADQGRTVGYERLLPPRRFDGVQLVRGSWTNRKDLWVFQVDPDLSVCALPWDAEPPENDHGPQPPGFPLRPAAGAGRLP